MGRGPETGLGAGAEPWEEVQMCPGAYHPNRARADGVWWGQHLLRAEKSLTGSEREELPWMDAQEPVTLLLGCVSTVLGQTPLLRGP